MNKMDMLTVGKRWKVAYPEKRVEVRSKDVGCVNESI